MNWWNRYAEAALDTSFVLVDDVWPTASGLWTLGVFSLTRLFRILMDEETRCQRGYVEELAEIRVNVSVALKAERNGACRYAFLGSKLTCEFRQDGLVTGCPWPWHSTHDSEAKDQHSRYRLLDRSLTSEGLGHPSFKKQDNWAGQNWNIQVNCLLVGQCNLCSRSSCRICVYMVIIFFQHGRGGTYSRLSVGTIIAAPGTHVRVVQVIQRFLRPSLCLLPVSLIMKIRRSIWFVVAKRDAPTIA